MIEKYPYGFPYTKSRKKTNVSSTNNVCLTRNISKEFDMITMYGANELFICTYICGFISTNLCDIE